MPPGVYQHTKRPLAQRFWEKVDRSGGPTACWPWTAGRSPTGYGKFNITCGVMRPAHRVAYELTYGSIPEGQVACHRCDHRACCNPSHVFLGTQAENIHDCVAKQRFARGSAMPHAKLTDELVRDIRRRVADGESRGSVARSLGVSRRLVQDVVARRRWAHVEVAHADR